MPDHTKLLVDALRLRISDPGAFLPRDHSGPESIPNWGARAIHAGLEDGALGYVPAEQRDSYKREVNALNDLLATARAERDQLVLDLATMTAVAQGNKRHVATLSVLLERVEKLTVSTDGDDLDDGAEIPAGEIRRALNEPIPGTAPVPGSSRHAPEAEPTGVHAWSETAGLSVVVVACTRCGIVQRRDGENGPCKGPGRVELREPVPTDDELAAEIDRAEEMVEAEAQAHAEGYAEAVARLRDDARYRDWWTSGGVKPDAPIRRHLADYLETVGPDGPDVTTGRWPAREQAVVRAAIAWRKMRAAITAPAGPRALALMEAVDALPHIDETPAPVAANPTINQALCADGIHEADGPCCSTGVGERPIDLDDRAPRPPAHTDAARLLQRLQEMPVEPAVADESGPLVAPVDGTPRETAAGRCGPDCSEGHTYEAGCAIQPPARAFLGEKPCGRPGCPCGS